MNVGAVAGLFAVLIVVGLVSLLLMANQNSKKQKEKITPRYPQQQELTITQFQNLYQEMCASSPEELKTVDPSVFLIKNIVKEKVYIAQSDYPLFAINAKLNSADNNKFTQDLKNQAPDFRIQIIKCAAEDCARIKKELQKQYSGINQKYK